jgi:hypothetical protein
MLYTFIRMIFKIILIGQCIVILTIQKFFLVVQWFLRWAQTPLFSSIWRKRALILINPWNKTIKTFPIVLIWLLIIVNSFKKVCIYSIHSNYLLALPQNLIFLIKIYWLQERLQFGYYSNSLHFNLFIII